MKVTAKLQAPHNSPHDMVWAKNADDLGVMLCVAQLLQHAKDEAPWAPELLSITIERD